jgi:hypothetical protein
MKIGYARVSTEDQKLTIQIEALKKAGCTRIFREKVSGAYRDRPELNRLLDQLRKGDVVTVWKLDRLARSTRNLLELVETIGNSGARFQSISEPWADTTLVLLMNKTGPGRLGFAALLKFFQAEGRFPSSESDVPAEAVEYLVRQTKVAPSCWAEYDWQGRTIKYHIRALYLRISRANMCSAARRRRAGSYTLLS